MILLGFVRVYPFILGVFGYCVLNKRDPESSNSLFLSYEFDIYCKRSLQTRIYSILYLHRYEYKSKIKKCSVSISYLMKTCDNYKIHYSVMS